MPADNSDRLKSFDISSRSYLLEILGSKSEVDFLAKAQSIAEEAGQMIIDEVLLRGMSVVVETSNEKSDGSPVSDIDLLAHAVLAKGLSEISVFPLVSEEDPSGPLSIEKISPGEFFWLADPLDGTRDFLAGEKTFAVALSLMRKSNSALEAKIVGHARGYWGTIVDPSERRSWAASRFNRLVKRVAGRQVAVARDLSSRPLRILGSRSIPSHRMEQLYQFWGSNDVTRMGSAIKFALIAEGLYDVYPRFGPTSEWDTAAGQILLEAEGGGLCSLQTGEPMLYGKQSWSNGGFLAARTTELLQTWTPRMRLTQT
ncbi:MAG: 3'(2'),5'-bisphosphate nucleotidase CysQ [Deltaproteobacteria bacterium]|nr:3'(2'),5'-bisphosphate nucleotidase CysQ [Deltaproteobacteria bacterium]